MNQELDNLVFNRLQSKETESPETGISLKLFLKFPLIMFSDYDVVLNCQLSSSKRIISNFFQMFLLLNYLMLSRLQIGIVV